MIRILLNFLLTVAFITCSHAQVYFQGEDKIPFTKIVKSNILNSKNRIDVETAAIKLKTLYPDSKFKHDPKNLTGEFWEIEGMLIQIGAFEVDPQFGQTDLKELEKVKFPKIVRVNGVPMGNSVNRRNDYYGKITRYKDFEVFVHYQKTLSNIKNFTINDHLKKYKIQGFIYVMPTDGPKSHAFIEEFLKGLSISL